MGSFLIGVLKLGRTVHITALKSHRGAPSVVCKSPFHSPSLTCIVCQMSRTSYALVRHFSKKSCLQWTWRFYPAVSMCAPLSHGDMGLNIHKYHLKIWFSVFVEGYFCKPMSSQKSIQPIWPFFKKIIFHVTVPLNNIKLTAKDKTSQLKTPITLLIR